MKYSFVALALGVTSVLGQSIVPGLPECATDCLVKGLASTGCEIVDFKCSCSNEAFVTGARTCIAGVCDEADQQKALEVAGDLCAKAGAPFPSAPASSSTSAPSSVSSVSSSASSVSAPSSAYPSETPEPTSVTPPTGTGTGGPIPPTNGTAPSNTAAPPPVDTGAASQIGVSLGALGLAIAGALMM